MTCREGRLPGIMDCTRCRPLWLTAILRPSITGVQVDWSKDKAVATVRPWRSEAEMWVRVVYRTPYIVT